MQTSATRPLAIPIDTRTRDFLSYAPPTRERYAGMEELRVSVEPEFGDLVDVAAQARQGFPLRPGKIQRPLLPEETLRRDRLFDWLAAATRRRATYIVAEAGFGKTTLVADYLRSSRIRTFWYRLDEDDTDGLVFLRYVVAACQAIDPRLMARSAAVLADVSIEPAEPVILRSVLDEIDCLGEVPSALVLDDFHVAEAVPAIGAVTERFISRCPSGLSLILVGRRTPRLSVAALRAHGDLAELGREELRFDESETGRLFRESYHHPLEPDVLHQIQARTEGWAASLQLVKAAVEGLSKAQVRAFVQSLTGAEGDLYDFLAEEVVGDLDADLRAFLMRVSLLEEIDAETAAQAAAVSLTDTGRLLGQAQKIGLLTKGVGTVGSWRLHPLVRDFLLARLEAEVGPAGVTELHRHLAVSLEPRSWRLAARHWAASGDDEDVRRVVCAALPTIIGTGDFAVAEELMIRFSDGSEGPWLDIIRARQLVAAGRYEEADILARRAEEATGATLKSRSFMIGRALNRLTLGIQRQDPTMRMVATTELAASGDAELAAIARAAELMCEASYSGSLDAYCATLLEAAGLSHLRNHRRHEGISRLNLSVAEAIRSNFDAAVAAGESAVELLQSAGNAGDIAAAHLNVAKALAHLGRWGDAQGHLAAALGDRTDSFEPEVVAEAAELHGMYGNPADGLELFRTTIFGKSPSPNGDYWRYAGARLEMIRGDLERASAHLSQFDQSMLVPGSASAARTLSLQLRAHEGATDPAWASNLEEGVQFAESQQAWFWSKSLRMTDSLVASSDELNSHLLSIPEEDQAHLSIQAELVVRRLADLDEGALRVVRKEAELRPDRWRWALRQSLESAAARPADIRRAAELLDRVGDSGDIKVLRKLAHRKSLRIPDVGRGLARRMAQPAFVEDLGRIAIRLGDSTIAGTDVRKKVLSLLAFLLSRPQFSASREQAIEALWPDMEPEAGANSLNQTSYFLRQVFEPKADDDTSAGYLNSRADLIWLDPRLVQSRSSECLKLIAAIRRDPSPALVTRLADSYTGRFAVDFIYDDWASTFRDALHASYLDRIERAIIADTRAGAFDRALATAQLAMQADPDAEQIELCLLRLYRRMGAKAAAAEQYAHYSNVMREQLGVEPPPLESI
jgi:DNA-binding SARP family transcriptional activator/tetratricopeptide (TPR) repeat protein